MTTRLNTLDEFETIKLKQIMYSIISLIITES